MKAFVTGLSVLLLICLSGCTVTHYGKFPDKGTEISHYSLWTDSEGIVVKKGDDLEVNIGSIDRSKSADKLGDSLIELGKEFKK